MAWIVKERVSASSPMPLLKVCLVTSVSEVGIAWSVPAAETFWAASSLTWARTASKSFCWSSLETARTVREVPPVSSEATLASREERGKLATESEVLELRLESVPILAAVTLMLARPKVIWRPSEVGVELREATVTESSS